MGEVLHVYDTDNTVVNLPDSFSVVFCFHSCTLTRRAQSKAMKIGLLISTDQPHVCTQVYIRAFAKVSMDVRFVHN